MFYVRHVTLPARHGFSVCVLPRLLGVFIISSVAHIRIPDSETNPVIDSVSSGTDLKLGQDIPGNNHSRNQIFHGKR